MSELQKRIRSAAAELWMVLDDDLPDALDAAAVRIADEFGLDDIETIIGELNHHYIHGE